MSYLLINFMCVTHQFLRTDLVVYSIKSVFIYSNTFIILIYFSFSDVKYILKVSPSGWFTMNLTSVHKKHIVFPWW